MNQYRKYGRRKAGTWGKPQKGNRTAANRAVRTANRRLAAKAKRSQKND